jgi:hypothetical protein
VLCSIAMCLDRYLNAPQAATGATSIYESYWSPPRHAANLNAAADYRQRFEGGSACLVKR